MKAVFKLFLVYLGWTFKVLATSEGNGEFPNENAISIVHIDDVPMKRIVDLVGVEGRAQLYQTCSYFRDFISGQSNDCQAMTQLFTAAMKCSQNAPLRAYLLEHLVHCPVKEGELPSKLDSKNNTISPLYTAINLKAWDVAEALLNRGGIRLQLKHHDYNDVNDIQDWQFHGVGQDVYDNLYYNPVWAAIQHQQFNLVHHIINSTGVTVVTESATVIPSTGYFIPPILGYFCGPYDAPSTDEAVQFCNELVNYPKGSYALGACHGLPNHPARAWTAFQKGLIEKVFIETKNGTIPYSFPYKGKGGEYPFYMLKFDYCNSNCDCAIVNAATQALNGSALSGAVVSENVHLIATWIKQLRPQTHKEREHRRTLLRIMMKNKHFSGMLSLVSTEDSLLHAFTGSYFPLHHTSQEKFRGISYDEALFLDAAFFGNEAINCHYLNTLQFLSLPFRTDLELSLKTCLGPETECVYGHGLIIPKHNMEAIRSCLQEIGQTQIE